MRIEVEFYDSPDTALAMGRDFLIDDPIGNNLILTLLAARISHPQPGRYWVARASGGVLGMALQSPHAYAVNVVATDVRAAGELADGIAAADFVLPGVSGEARIAARFAGQWAERRKTPACPTGGQRIYDVRVIQEGALLSGAMRRAGHADQPRLCEWVGAFQAETGGAGDVSAFVRQRVSAGEIWLWDDDGACCMAAATSPAEGVSRVQYVYTPPTRRRKGYAEALVRSLTRHLLDVGLQPILFTDLGNPTSNAIYRRIGYHAAIETLHYSFAAPKPNGL
jgi:GNAT superfamily N-acetyltransferase